jgi:hypothetical protein
MRISSSFGIGLYHSRRQRTTSEYFLAGHSLDRLPSASTVSTNINNEHFIRLAGSEARSGLAVGCYDGPPEAVRSQEPGQATREFFDWLFAFGDSFTRY